MLHWKVTKRCSVPNWRHMTCWMWHYLSGSVKETQKNVETIYIKTEKNCLNPQKDRFNVILLGWKQILVFIFEENTRQNSPTNGDVHTNIFSTHVQTQSTSLPGMTTWQCTTKSQKLRGIFDLTVHAEAIFQHGWTTKFYCTLFCAVLFNSLRTTHRLYKLKTPLQSKTKNQALKWKQRKEVSRIRLNPPLI